MKLSRNGIIIKIVIIRRFFINFFKTKESIGTALTMAIDPRTRAIFAVFDPMAFPTAKFDSLLIAATIDTKISGAEVANATIVKPITIIGILRILAIEVEPSTKKSDPRINKYIPIESKIRDVIINLVLLKLIEHIR
tara:strand:+ start:1139 stop:1549 length:411 start_codon:yes stop_codon:yes gene_type:complete